MLDVDNDGRLDLFFTNGARIDDPQPSGKPPDKSDPRFWNRMYQQKEDGTFVDVTEKAGLSGAADGVYGMGVAVGDYDNDGFADLYVTSYGGNRLYRNKGDGTFADVTGRAGVGAGGWSASAGFFDYDNDGKLDLFVTRYLAWTFQNNRHCGEKKPGYRAYCHPDNFDGATNILYRNNGNGTFTDVSAKAGIAGCAGQGPRGRVHRLRPRRLRRRLCRQRLRAVLPLPQQPGRHVHGSRPARRRRIQRGRKDLRRHGRGLRRLRQRRSRRHHRHRPLERTLHVVPPERRRQLPRRDEPDRRRRRHASVLGVEHALLRLRQRWLEGPVRRPGPRHGYHREDLAELEVSAAAAALAERAGAFRQGPGGRRFSARSGPAAAPRSAIWTTTAIPTSWSATSGRRPTCCGTTAAIAATGWAYERSGTRSNRDGIGSQVKVVTAAGLTQHFTVNTAVGYLSASDKRLLVGLGADASAKLVEIRWPSGAVQTFDNVKSRQMLVATEPAAAERRGSVVR